MKKIAILTSGGDAPGMNACIRAIVRYGISQGLKVYGINRGYAGLIENDINLMNERTVGNIIQLGGTILKTARCKEFMTPQGVDKAVENLKAKNIDGVVVIGGDGSMRGALELKKRGVKKLKVLYSKETPIKHEGQRIPASISFTPPVAGLIIAGEVVRDLMG